MLNQDYTNSTLKIMIILLYSSPINKSDLSDEELKRGKDLILDYSDIFSKSDTDVGHTNIVQHRIELLEDKTFKQRYRRIPLSMYDEVKVYTYSNFLI